MALSRSPIDVPPGSSPQPAGWQPLFSGTAAAPYERAIDAIVQSIETHDAPPVDWGPALVHAYLAAAHSSAVHLDRADALVDRAVEAVETRNYGMSLYAGVAGVG